MTTPTPPPIDDDRVDAMERNVFARISAERSARRRTRTRVWGGVGAAAAVVIVAAVIAPGLAVNQSGGASLTEQGVPGVIQDGTGGSASEDFGSAAAVPDMAGSAGSQSGDGDLGAAAGREIVANGNATVEVDDVAAAIARITDAATAVGGYVESSQVGVGGAARPLDQAIPAAPDATSGWITLRVPADALAGVMDDLAQVGTVTSTSVSRSDVTDQAVDLRARVAAAEASVARLTELIAQAGSVGDLITAESALSERQAQLDADRQQLELLQGQVALSSLSVQVEVARETVVADPAGFGDGLASGWNGLIATLNGIVVALGFLLPWLAVAAIVAAVVWGVRRGLRGRRRSREG